MEEENEAEEDIDDDDLLNTEDELPIIKVRVSSVFIRTIPLKKLVGGCLMSDFPTRSDFALFSRVPCSDFFSQCNARNSPSHHPAVISEHF